LARACCVAETGNSWEPACECFVADSNGHPKSEPATWSSEESRRHYDAEKLRSMMKLTRPAEFDAEAQERLCELIARAKSKQVKPGD